MAAIIQPRIRQPLKSKSVPYRYRPHAIIMGRTGAGKTTLVNLLCGTKHTAGEGRGSITRHLFCNDVSYGDHLFSLIDTPGTDSSNETYKHALLLREGLTARQINTIFIVIKYDSRFDKMIENYFEVEQPVYNYTHKIVVMISYWDQAKNPDKSYQEICDLFKEDCPTVSNIILYSEHSSSSDLANLMYNCISNMKNEKLQIKDEDFFLKFNICEMKKRMKVSFKEYQRKTKLLKEDYEKLIASVLNDPGIDKDEVYHLTIVKFRNELDSSLEEFQQKYAQDMAELDYYALSIKMQKENVEICDNFVENVVPLMSYNLFDNKDPRNLIKRCPFCQLIWFKTEGCDGITTCGNNDFEKPTSSNFMNPNFWKYQLERIDGKLKLIQNPPEPTCSETDSDENSGRFVETTNPRSNSNMYRNFMLHCKNLLIGSARNTDNIFSRKIGCGKKLKWSDLPKIEDELILELFKVQTIDQAKQLIRDGSFQELRENYESNIDTTMHK